MELLPTIDHLPLATAAHQLTRRHLAGTA
jgi:hypothetical protein